LPRGPFGAGQAWGCSSDEYAMRILSLEKTLVICGHSHWDEPLAELPGGAQVLNVDGRAVLLRRGT
jgi:hypothetical protein